MECVESDLECFSDHDGYSSDDQDHIDSHEQITCLKLLAPVGEADFTDDTVTELPNEGSTINPQYETDKTLHCLLFIFIKAFEVEVNSLHTCTKLSNNHFR